MPLQVKQKDTEENTDLVKPSETQKSLGETLQLKRESLGLSIDDVCVKTKIRKAFIIAIENNDLDQLPGKVYTKGFLVTYINLLGLSPQLIDEQNQNLKKQLQVKPSPFKFYVYKEESTSITQKIILISMILLLIVWGISKLKQSTPTSQFNIQIENPISEDKSSSPLSLIQEKPHNNFNSTVIEQENTIVQRNEEQLSFAKETSLKHQDSDRTQQQSSHSLIKQINPQISSPEQQSPKTQTALTPNEENEEED